jgi:hypothetical protein
MSNKTNSFSNLKIWHFENISASHWCTSFAILETCGLEAEVESQYREDNVKYKSQFIKGRYYSEHSAGGETHPSLQSAASLQRAAKRDDPANCRLSIAALSPTSPQISYPPLQVHTYTYQCISPSEHLM